jgi:hypothetical protein
LPATVAVVINAFRLKHQHEEHEKEHPFVKKKYDGMRIRNRVRL